MEFLDFLKPIIATLSCLQIISVFLIDKKKSKCFLYATLTLSGDLLLTMNGLATYSNLVYLLVTYVFLAKIHGLLKGFAFAITIFAAFQWIIAFLGSLAFILFPSQNITGSFAFITILACAYLGTAILLSKHSNRIFRIDSSNKLLLLDTTVKLFFVLFFNLIFPRYFGILGIEHYSILSLILLVIALLFMVYREYSISLESQLAIGNSNLLLIAQWVHQTNSRYERSNSPHSENINTITNPVVQAILYELANASERLGISLNISSNTTSSVNTINLNDYDLFNIINEFIDNALYEANTQNNKSIEVTIDDKDGFKFMVRTELDSAKSASNKIISDFRIKKDTIMNQIIKNSNISISFSKTDCFLQVLSVDV